jgi:tetratricopeptide (TPR) repeat protein
LILLTAAVIAAVSIYPIKVSHNAEPPTFNKQIAPIIYEYCAACHHAGGAAPFSLMTFADVRKHARLIADVTASRYMPPWLPDAGYAEFSDERRLNDEQIKLIRQWVDAGTPEGDAKELPPAPQFNESWQLGKPDLIVRMNESFVVPAEGADVFRNFVLPIPVAATKYVKAIEILPGNKRVVHHANILIDRTGSARQLDAQDPEPGFGGMEVSVEAESFDPDSHFLFWKPGSTPAVEPDGMAWRCDPGTDLVLNMHLQPTGKPERIQAEIGLYFTDKPQTIFPMLLQLEHDGAIDIPPGAKEFVISDELKLPVDVDVLGVYPHAHYLGKDLQGFATLPDGTKKWLVRITRWDLNWQGVYKLRQPIFLPQGSVLQMRYSYDNSADNPRNPHHPPQRVRAGNRSSEEMGHLWVQVLPRLPQADGKDARVALQEALMRRRLQKYPADFTAHFNLGAALQLEGRNAEAIANFQKALQARPNHPAALTNLAVALQVAGRTAEAINYYRQALRANPDYASARYNLANLLLAKGDVAEAITHLRESLRLRPDDAGAHNSLGSALAMQNNLTEAATHFAESVRLNPDNADAQGNFAAVLAALNKPNEAISHYEQALRLNPNNADAHNELGALLAGQGKLKAAVPHFEQAVKLDPNNAAARENLKRAQAMIK